MCGAGIFFTASLLCFWLQEGSGWSASWSSGSKVCCRLWLNTRKCSASEGTSYFFCFAAPWIPSSCRVPSRLMPFPLPCFWLLKWGRVDLVCCLLSFRGQVRLLDAQSRESSGSLGRGSDLTLSGNCCWNLAGLDCWSVGHRRESLTLCGCSASPGGWRGKHIVIVISSCLGIDYIISLWSPVKFTIELHSKPVLWNNDLD